MFWCYFPLVALIATAPMTEPAHEGRPDKLIVTVSPHVSPSGDNVRAVVHVDRHADNRLLRIAIEGPDFVGATERQLDGKEAARTFDVVWNRLPPGDYVVTVAVQGTNRLRHQASRTLTVTGGQTTGAPTSSSRDRP